MTADNQQPPTYYANVADFVEQYLVHIYQRQVTDTTDAVWCPQWWRHAEAAIRLDALWRAWEYCRRNPRTGLSVWFLDHADKHMAKLFDPAGPFKFCSVRSGHQQLLVPLHLAPPPEGLFDQQQADPSFHYESLVRFVTEYLSHLYGRQVTDTTESVWCPAWWSHHEATARLDSLWRAWEYYRPFADTGMSSWLLEHADLQMKVLMDPTGPFRYCNARGGHKDLLRPLPVVPADTTMMFSTMEDDPYLREYAQPFAGE